MKKIIKSICLSFLAFMFAIGSIFLPLGKQNKNYASANYVTQTGYSFTSSNIIFSVLGGTTGTIDPNVGVGQLSNSVPNWFNGYSFSFRINLSDGTLPSLQSSIYNDHYNFVGSSGLNSSTYTNYSTFATFSNFIQPSYSTDVIRPSYGFPLYFYTKASASTTKTTILYSVDYVTDDPRPLASINLRDSNEESLTFVSVEIGNSSDFNLFALTNYDLEFASNCNIVSYLAKNGVRFTFFIPLSNDADYSYLSYRKYYFSRDLTDNDYYNQGVIDGKAQGFDSGYNDGYSAGTSVGYENGFENGKIQGGIESNNYSFFGLISAVIDAPVRILTSLFNFEFLGVNLWAFFTSILTISLIIFVIRKFMAKG